MQNQLDLTKLKCQRCKQQLRFVYDEITHYGCFRSPRALCSKTLIAIILLITLIIALLVILTRNQKSAGSLYLGLIVTITILALILMPLLIYFIQKNMTFKEIILVRMYEYT